MLLVYIGLYLSATLGSMDYGKGMESCTLAVIWCLLLERVIIAKIGSMLKFQGTAPTPLVYVQTSLAFNGKYATKFDLVCI